ncbi:MAG: hypothetical protein OXG72_09035, partial [Acidobacteria bacterium]|nr:hypothetical protein [Acidobacteriota bacterium]
MSIRPDWRFQIDWEDDGYRSQYADMTDAAASWDVRFGCNPNLDSRGPSVAEATGRLVVHNDGRFDPNSSKAVLSAAVLRSSHKCRITADGAVAWEGTARQLDRVGTGDVRFAAYSLRSANHQQLANRRINLDNETGDISSAVELVSSNTGIPIASDSSMPVGIMIYRGPVARWLDLTGRYSGGWALEDKSGNWELHSWAEQSSRDVDVSLDLGYGPVERSLSVGERSGWVRNRCELRGWEWGAADAERTLSVATRPLRRNQTRWVRLNVEPGTFRPVAWTKFAVSPDTAANIIAVDRSKLYAPRVRLQGVGDHVGAEEIRVTGTASVEEHQTVASQQLVCTEFGSRDVYGDSELIQPPWFSSGHAGADGTTRDFLRLLATPPVVLQATYPDLQDSSQRAARLVADAVPGNVAAVQYVSEGRTRSLTGLILAARLSWRIGGVVMRTVTVVENRDATVVPLALDGWTATDRTVTLRISTPTPAREAVYVRLKQGSTVIGPFVVEAQTEISTLLVSGLTQNTSYTVEISRAEDFGASLDSLSYAAGAKSTLYANVTATVRTERTVNNTYLKKITLTGGDVTLEPDWDYTRRLDQAVDLRLDDLVNVQVNAEAEDSSATVTVTGAPFQGVNNSVQTVTIKVTKGGDSRVYVMTVYVAAPVENEIDDLSSFGIGNPTGMHSNGSLVWIPDNTDRRLYCLDLHTKTRVSAFELNLRTQPWASGAFAPSGTYGVTGDGGSNLWVLMHRNNTLVQAYGYSIGESSLSRNSSIDWQSAVIRGGAVFQGDGHYVPLLQRMWYIGTNSGRSSYQLMR